MLVGLLGAYSLPAQAEGIEAGQSLVSVAVGAAIPMQKSGVYVEEDSENVSEELRWAKAGIASELSYTYFVNEYVGVGLALGNGMFFDKKTSFAYSGGSTENIKTKMNTWSALITGRFNVNPQSAVRFYIPLGLGYMRAKGTIKDTWVDGEDTESDTMSARSNSFGWFAGLGVETDITENWLVGAELRYTAFRFDTNKYMEEEPFGGSRGYGYGSVMLKAGYRF